ncbi:alpha/beta fold hydrolase [Clostridium sp. 'White wine YQ']|uniref:alpha/beta fold hydrolase n=1 Tax=Clostridium sp. 'White wine YQ' TaxID=3027474 RepID=UPI002366BD02|nr:alpha/beta hydrolase [Clostridium sp. 'White wine YQ']MDD7796284.1 alpha/beta hydrolase [Clostridium sp. 'White wine YQ']
MENSKLESKYLNSVTCSTVVSEDGTKIGYRSFGEGPGLIVIHGALSSSAEFMEFAEALSASFTVHVLDRRGRGLSGPQGEDYSIYKECEDVKAVQGATGAEYIFGHSYGGLVTLEAVRKGIPVTKIALYEPGVTVHSNPSDWTWIFEYEKAMNKKDFRGAFAFFVRGAGHTPLTKMPLWYAKFILRMMIRGEHWKRIQKLLSENLNEHKQVMSLSSTFTNYENIDTEILLISGEKSPKSVHEMMQVLRNTIPKAKSKVLAKLDHLAPENRNAPVEVAKHVKNYFL